MISVDKEEVKSIHETNIHYKLHVIKEKLKLFSKKYNCEFEEFESKVLNSEQEDYEMWDDYMEWKGYYKSYQNLLQEKEKINDEDFKIIKNQGNS